MDEIEVKVFLSKKGIKQLEKRLKALKAKKSPSVFEKNFIYDFADDSFSKSGRLLRLRFIGEKCIMIYKEPIAGSEKSRFKSKKETQAEMTAAEGEKMRELFARSGLRQKWRYDKKREGYEFGKIRISIDALPVIGTVVEVEARSEGELEKALKELRLEKEKQSKKNYFEVAKRHFRKKKTKPRDLVWGK